jgi:hypothetical protein
VELVDPRRGLTTFAFTLTVLTASCSSAESANSDAPTADLPQQQPSQPVCAAANPPPAPPFVPNAQCPSLRTGDAQWGSQTQWPRGVEGGPTSLSGIYEDCTGRGGIEIRYDAQANRFDWYRLDGRLVRLTGFDYVGAPYGTFRVDSCCAITWTEYGDGRTFPRGLGVWQSPIGLTMSGRLM